MFDEGLVNARDHFIRVLTMIEEGQKCHPVKNINVEIDKETGMITIMNDGNGIDVAKHQNTICGFRNDFGHLRTSTNYDQNQKKIVGGKNGLVLNLFLSILCLDELKQLIILEALNISKNSKIICQKYVNLLLQNQSKTLY